MCTSLPVGTYVPYAVACPKLILAELLDQSDAGEKGGIQRSWDVKLRGRGNGILSASNLRGVFTVMGKPDLSVCCPQSSL